MFVPFWALALLAVVLLWLAFAAAGRNLLPFPDNGSRIFSATSHAAQDAVVALLAHHGVRQRFRGDTPGVRRAIMWDGTIINCPEPWVLDKLGDVSGSIGLVVADPAQAAEAAARFLRERGFEARVILDAEPEIPIAFVVTTAMRGIALNFRKHAVRFPMPQPLAS